MVLAGEASGDMHAAALVRALRERWDGPVEFRGTGGEALRAEGVALLGHADQMAVIGLFAVLGRARFFLRLLRTVRDEIARWRPHLVLTIDYPGFNLRVAARARAKGFTTVHYICPQVWAWHRGRIPKIARSLDRLITLFPFEPACFRETGLAVTFAGHPLVDRARESFAEPLADLPWGDAPRRVALLPGSRRGEIERILPILLAAAAELDRDPGGCTFLIPASTPAMRALAEAIVARTPEAPRSWRIVDGQARQALRQAHAAAIASGTATLEACLMRCPSILVYRMGMNWLVGRAARRILATPFVGLVNIVAGRAVMPELLHGDCNPANVAAALRPLLADETRRAAMLAEFDAVAHALGDGNASGRAADAILETLRDKAAAAPVPPPGGDTP
jgi:lipid-A-disaccharide synthase